jgi:hypothetical protein
MQLEPKETGHCAGFFVGGIWLSASTLLLETSAPKGD